MDHPTTSDRPRKRRAINACLSCRTSKVRCDGGRPCARCIRNDTPCLFQDGTRDENVLRMDRLESELAALRKQMQTGHAQSASIAIERNPTPVPSPQLLRGRNTVPNAVDAGIITWDQARVWFQSFFSGSHYLVPIFCEKYNNLTSVSSSSAFLLDAIVSIGCRAEEGFNSASYHQLQSRTRDHVTNLLINTKLPSVEDVQAITLMAAYSENGFVLIALALRFAAQLGLPRVVDQLVARGHGDPNLSDGEEKELYRLSRIWHGICNIELFFSLDGGKLPGVTLHTSSRKIRSLVAHPERTAIDVRLLSQIELNIIRADAYKRIVDQTEDTSLRSIIHDTSVELDLWLREWTALVLTEQTPYQRAVAIQNLNIQREWALMTLHLKAIARSGIENIAFMTDSQREFVILAKEAAARHLHFVLQDSTSPFSSPSIDADHQVHNSTYLSTFRWTLDYVWAKCAFSILLVLKLAILVRDPVPSVMLLLHDAHRVLEELKRVTVGHIAYFQILQTSIEKCEAALKEYVAQQTAEAGLEAPVSGAGVAEDEFQGYIPNEFVFEWDFPGLNLKHMPLGWQDLFINIDGLF